MKAILFHQHVGPGVLQYADFPTPEPGPGEALVRLHAALVFHTAWHSLITRGKLQPAEHVLIVGASGGVNTASIQIAKYIGARVYVVGSSAEKLSMAESLGADELIDRNRNEN